MVKNIFKKNVSSETGATEDPKKKVKPSKPSVPADSGSTPEKTSGVKTKFTNKKTNDPAPSTMGIQKLREYLEEARIRGNLSTDDKSEYLKAMDGFKASAGDKEAKAGHLKTMRSIYKRNRSV